jgi:hypothetical protein
MHSCQPEVVRSLVASCFIKAFKVTGRFLYPLTSGGQLPMFLLHLRCLAVICDDQATTGKTKA